MAIYQEFSQLNTEGIYLKLQVGLVDLAFTRENTVLKNKFVITLGSTVLTESSPS